MAHLCPEADVPVIQLSINALKPFEFHVDLGTKLAALRKSGIILLGSGNVVHNLGRLQWDQPNRAFDWNERFDDAVVKQIEADPAAILKLTGHPDFQLAVPTPDHFIPLLYMAGVAAASGDKMRPIVRGYSMGSISMTCYGIGIEADCIAGDDAATLPAGVPPDQTNV